jgi:hypothetical protein
MENRKQEADQFAGLAFPVFGFLFSIPSLFGSAYATLGLGRSHPVGG